MNPIQNGPDFIGDPNGQPTRKRGPPRAALTPLAEGGRGKGRPGDPCRRPDDEPGLAFGRPTASGSHSEEASPAESGIDRGAASLAAHTSRRNTKSPPADERRPAESSGRQGTSSRNRASDRSTARRPGVAARGCRAAQPAGDEAMVNPGGAGGYLPFATGCGSGPSRQRVENGHGLAACPGPLRGVRRGDSRQRESGVGQDAGPAAVGQTVGADGSFLCPRDRAGTVRRHTCAQKRGKWIAFACRVRMKNRTGSPDQVERFSIPYARSARARAPSASRGSMADASVVVGEGTPDQVGGSEPVWPARGARTATAPVPDSRTPTGRYVARRRCGGCRRVDDRPHHCSPAWIMRLSVAVVRLSRRAASRLSSSPPTR